MTRVEKSPIRGVVDPNRNRVYESIAQKLSSHASNPSMSTVNDEDVFLDGNHAHFND